MLADCLHDLTALGPGGLAALLGAMFLAGLAGGATHCSAMCGPFVLAQAAATADRALAGGVLRRLAGAALLPYQAGRALGYAALGAVAGGAGALLAQASGLRFAAAALLLVAALVMLAQASSRLAAVLPRLPAPRLPESLRLAPLTRLPESSWLAPLTRLPESLRIAPLTRLPESLRLAPLTRLPESSWLAPLTRLPPMLAGALGGLLAAPTGWRGVRLGLLLSALPCGLLYAALAGAVAAGSALAGALAMLAFVLGTVPALVGVAFLGRASRHAFGPALRVVSGALFAVNAAVLTVLAARLVA